MKHYSEEVLEPKRTQYYQDLDRADGDKLIQLIG